MTKNKKAVSKRQSYDDVWKNVSVDGHFKADIPPKMLELFKQEKVQTVLDLGAGDGTIAVALAKQGKTMHALEISNEGIEKIKKHAQMAQVSVHTLEQDMYRALPFEDSSLDAVIAFQSLNHNTLGRIEKLFAEITRILKKILEVACIRTPMAAFPVPYDS